MLSSERPLQGAFVSSTSAPAPVWWSPAAEVGGFLSDVFAKGMASPMDFVVVLPMMSVVAAGCSGCRLFGRRRWFFLPLLPFTSWRSMVSHRSSWWGDQALSLSKKLDASCEDWRWIKACFKFLMANLC
jgi:hypothetical protein